VFPTAGGDAEEIERFQLIAALSPLLEAGRIKVYSTDSVACRVLLAGEAPPSHCSWLMNQFDAFLYHEVVPAIRMDCKDPAAEVVAAGSSIGAFNSLAVLSRHPDVFSAAICMSGTYDLDRLLKFEVTEDFYYSSPLHFLSSLGESEQLRKLRTRYVFMTHGRGRWEDPEQDFRMAKILGEKGVPNRVEPWGEEWDHDWPTWRVMLPHYLGQIA